MEYINYYKIMLTSILFSETKNKKIILEPISCIIKLILMIYKEEGTKISILNNAIDFYEPSHLQGFLRNINGDTREDLHNIYQPLLKCIEWYPPHENNIYQYFYTKCKEGIQKLLLSYDKETTISHTLELYCRTLTSALNGKEIDNEGNNEEDKKDSPLLDKLKSFWEKKELELLYKQLQIIEHSNGDEKKTYIENVINTISMKEKKLYNLIQKTITTY